MLQINDLVFDAWGMLSFGASKHLMKPTAVFMSTGPGPHLQNLYRLPLAPLSRGRKVVFAPPSFDQSTMQYLADLLATRRLTPPIDRCYPLEEIVEVRVRGYAIDDGEESDGVFCMAFPVTDKDDRVVCALSVSAPSNRLGVDDAPGVAEILTPIVRVFTSELAGLVQGSDPGIDSVRSGDLAATDVARGA